MFVQIIKQMFRVSKSEYLVNLLQPGAQKALLFSQMSTAHISMEEHQIEKARMLSTKGATEWLSRHETYEEDEAHHDRSQRRAHKSQEQEWCSTWKLPSEAQMEICNMCNIETEI